MLEISHLTKSFGKGKVIDDFSYEFKYGKITAILGESGCGKTTLLRCIAGLEIINSLENISFAFQEDRLLPWLTVSENINLVLGENPESDEEIKKLLINFDLHDIENSFPSELSGGMRQRVSLARAYVHKSELLLMDEPFSELDEGTKSRVIDFLIENKKERTIIYITHSQKEAESFADEIITFNSSYISNSNMSIKIASSEN